MTVEDAAKALQSAALDAARAVTPISDTPDARAAYASGVRAMAGLVHAASRVAEEMAKQNTNNFLAHDMLKGYAISLALIVAAADDLIPPGYER